MAARKSLTLTIALASLTHDHVSLWSPANFAASTAGCGGASAAWPALSSSLSGESAPVTALQSSEEQGSQPIMHAPPSGAGKLHVQVLVFLGPAACWMSQPCWFLGLGDRVGNKQVGNGGSDLEESEFWTWEAQRIKGRWMEDPAGEAQM